MKTKNLLVSFALLFGLLSIAVAFQKPNFSGKWELDKIKSFSNPPGLEQSATITQTGEQITFDTKVKTGNNPEQKLTETYTLDGKETEFKPAQPPNAAGKRTASWLPNGRGVLIKDEISVDGKVVELKKLKGKSNVVLAFYPKAFTGG